MLESVVIAEEKASKGPGDEGREPEPGLKVVRPAPEAEAKGDCPAQQKLKSS